VSARAAAFLMGWLGSMVCCLLVLPVAGCDRVGWERALRRRRSAYRRLEIGKTPVDVGLSGRVWRW